ncbi:MAG: DUF4350 domain-containing protein [Chloroflexota bacterium]
MSRRLVLLGVLFLVLVVGLVLLPPATQRQVPLTTYSAEPAGGKALALWLETLGYRMTTLTGDRYTIGPGVGVLLLLAPSQFVGSEAQGELERWTRQGGRLVVATDGFQTWELLRRFDVSVRPADQIERAVPAGPGLLDPAITTTTVDAHWELVLDDAPGALPLLIGQRGGEEASAEGRPTGPVLAARVPAGRGQLVVLADPLLLSNDGLHDEAHARLALSLIGPDEQKFVAVDEIHHGFGSLRRLSLSSLLLEQSWGRAVVLAGGLVLVFLLLRGRRFGRAVPVFVDRGRSFGELVTSQASLLRAGGKRDFVAEHLARQLRLEVAQAVGLPADAPDDAIRARATALGRDPSRALYALASIRQARSDRALLAVTRDAEAARAELSRSGPTPSPSPLRWTVEGSR